MIPTVQRVIVLYSNETDFLVDHVHIDILLAVIQKIFDVPADNPMFDCYEINSKNAHLFDPFVKIDYDFERYSYMLEAWALE